VATSLPTRHFLRLSGERCAAKASRRCKSWISPKNASRPAAWASECRQEQPPEPAGKYLHRQKKAGLAAHPARPVDRYPATRHNHMNVRMVGHCRAPAVEHSGGADASAEYLGLAAIVSSVSAAVRSRRS